MEAQSGSEISETNNPLRKVRKEQIQVKSLYSCGRESIKGMLRVNEEPLNINIVLFYTIF